MINPYQTPTESSKVRQASGVSGERHDTCDDETFLSGLGQVRLGYVLVIVAMVGVGSWLSENHRDWTRFTASPVLVMSLVFAGVGFGVTVSGLALWGTSSSLRIKYFALLALVLQTVSMTAAGFYVFAVLNGPVSSRTHLFGATSFAALLGSQMVIALLMRSWAKKLWIKFPVHASALAVIGFATSAVLVSSIAIDRSGDHRVAFSWTSFALVILSIAIQKSSAFSIARRVQAKAASRDDHSDSPEGNILADSQ